MRKIAEGLYLYRGVWIFKNKDGWWCDGSLHIFKALADVKEHIQPTGKRKPRIVREWTIEEDYNK